MANFWNYGLNYLETVERFFYTNKTKMLRCVWQVLNPLSIHVTFVYHLLWFVYWWIIILLYYNYSYCTLVSAQSWWYMFAMKQKIVSFFIYRSHFLHCRHRNYCQYYHCVHLILWLSGPTIQCLELTHKTFYSISLSKVQYILWWLLSIGWSIFHAHNMCHNGLVIVRRFFYCLLASSL